MRQLRFFFLVTGLGLLLLGATLIAGAYSMPRPRLENAAESTGHQGGEASCFTCHDSDHLEWSYDFHAPMSRDAHLGAAVTVSTFRELPLVKADKNTGAYILDDSNQALRNEYHQRYIMQAETGYAVLPRQWDMPEVASALANIAVDDWLARCYNCHTDDAHPASDVGAETGLTCVVCHGPGIIQLEALLSPGDLSTLYGLKPIPIYPFDAHSPLPLGKG